jgi:hypothetical protein
MTHPNQARDLTIEALTENKLRQIADIFVTSTVEVNAVQLKAIITKLTPVIEESIGQGFDSGKTEGWNIGKAIGEHVMKTKQLMMRAQDIEQAHNRGYQVAKKDIAILVSHVGDNEDITKIVRGLVPKSKKEIETA